MAVADGWHFVPAVPLARNVEQGVTSVQSTETISNGPQRGREADDARISRLFAPLLLRPSAAKTSVRSAVLNWDVLVGSNGTPLALSVEQGVTLAFRSRIDSRMGTAE